MVLNVYKLQANIDLKLTVNLTPKMIGLSSVLCPRQHSIGYMGDRNVSLVMLKEYQPTFRNWQTRNIQREDES